MKTWKHRCGIQVGASEPGAYRLVFVCFTYLAHACCIFGVFSPICFVLSVAVQVIAWKDWSLKWPFMCRAGRKTHSLTYFFCRRATCFKDWFQRLAKCRQCIYSDCSSLVWCGATEPYWSWMIEPKWSSSWRIMSLSSTTPNSRKMKPYLNTLWTKQVNSNAVFFHSVIKQHLYAVGYEHIICLFYALLVMVQGGCISRPPTNSARMLWILKLEQINQN